MEECKECQLSDKQICFCEEYVKDFNATQAAIRAGYSEKTARSQGQRLLTKVDIQNYLTGLQNEISERNKITVDECVSILAKIARFDIADIYDETGALKPVHEIPKDARIVISSIETEQLYENVVGVKIPIGFVKKVKTIDRINAIDKLMKHLGGYEKDNSQKQPQVDLSKLPSDILIQIWNARIISNG